MGLRRLSLQAQLLIERINGEIVTKQEFIETDMILHYYAKLMFKEGYSCFPITYVYRDSEDSPLRFFIKLKSERRAEKVAPLFNLTSSDELSVLIYSYEQNGVYGYSNSFTSVPKLQTIINPD